MRETLRGSARSVPVVRSIIALVGGYAIMVLVLVVVVAIAAWIFHPSRGAPSPPFLLASLVSSGLAALAGGYSTATLAPVRPRAHSFGLGVMILATSISTASHSTPGQPAWSAGAAVVIGPLFAILGGLLRQPRLPSPVPT